MISVSIRVLESMLDDLSNGEANTNAGKGGEGGIFISLATS